MPTLKLEIASQGALEAVGFKGGIALQGDSSELGDEPLLAATQQPTPPQGQYKLVGEIARGGMGAILKAIDNDLHRPVAMKVMLGDNETLRARFVEEAQITGQLEHPGIVPVHELGADKRGRLYFTMKLVQGRSLADVMLRLRQGDDEVAAEFTLPRLVRLLVDVADAVAFAHHKGVVHRDLKPANIMLGAFGEVLVMDWGLAKIVGKQTAAPGTGTRRRMARKGGPTDTGEPQSFIADAAADLDTMVSSQRSGTGAHLTLDGTVAGTPAYMAPEQARGEIGKIDRRSDVYALGAILYEMLTLVPPVQGKTNKEVLAKVIAGRFDPPEKRTPGRMIPSELSAIAMKALSRERHLRYQFIVDFRRDLELYLDGRAVSAKADSAWETLVKLVRRNRGASAAIIAAVVLIVSVSAIAFAVNLNALRQARVAQDKAEKALADVRAEHALRATAERAAAPALIFQARAAVDTAHYDDALKDLALALEFDPDQGEAHLLRAQLLVVKRDFANALADLESCSRLHPGDENIRQLGGLCQKAQKAGDSSALSVEFAVVLAHQGASNLATAMAGSADKIVAVHRERLERIWPGAGKQLNVDANGHLRLDLAPFKSSLTDLGPLRGIALSALSLAGCSGVSDLTPLKGMPLTALNLEGCAKISDISALRDMPLSELRLIGCNKIADFALLHSLPLKYLNLQNCSQITEIAFLKGTALNELILRNSGTYTDLHSLAGIPIEVLDISNSNTTNLDQLVAATGPTLRKLCLWQIPAQDFSPLAQLTTLTDLEFTPTPQLKGLDKVRQMKGLRQIDFQTAADFWKKFDAGEAFGK